MVDVCDQLYVYIDEYTIVEIIEEQALIEALVEMYFPSNVDEDKQLVIDLLYGLLRGEAGSAEVYDTLFDLLIAPVDAEYAIAVLISDYLFIEDSEGREKVNEFVGDILVKMANREKIDVVEELKSLFNLVNTYTSNEIVRIAVESIEELEPEEILHLSSTIVEKYWKDSGKVITIEEYREHYFDEYYVPEYIDNQTAIDLVNKMANAEKTFMRGYENLFENLITIDSEEALKTEVLNFIGIRKFYVNEMIEVLEIQKDNSWLLVKEESDGYLSRFVGLEITSSGQIIPNYEYEEELYLEELADLEEAYSYIEQHTILEMIKENGVVESFVLQYFDSYSQEAKDKLVDLIYGVLEGQKEKEDIYKVLFDVFVIGENEELRVLMDYINTYKEEGLEGLFNSIVDTYKENIVSAIMDTAAILGIESNLQMKEDIEQLVVETLDAYLDGTLDVDVLSECIKDIFDEYASEDVKTRIAIYTILYNVFNYDENVDYNELFENLQLPNQVANIDYNEMMKKIVNESTYDVFKVKDIEVEYLVDENDNIIGEIVHLVVDIDFDVLMVSLKGNLKVDLKLELANNG